MDLCQRERNVNGPRDRRSTPHELLSGQVARRIRSLGTVPSYRPYSNSRSCILVDVPSVLRPSGMPIAVDASSPELFLMVRKLESDHKSRVLITRVCRRTKEFGDVDENARTGATVAGHRWPRTDPPCHLDPRIAGSRVFIVSPREQALEW